MAFDVLGRYIQVLRYHLLSRNHRLADCPNDLGECD